MGRKRKILDNTAVAEWLIQHRWQNILNSSTKQMMPAFVEDAVMAALYIVAGDSGGRLNLSPKLVFKTLMLKEISSSSVVNCEVGYEMSERHARRLAQTARFALDCIAHRIQEYEANLSEDELFNWKLEKGFVDDYYAGRHSKLYSDKLCTVPHNILQLWMDKKYAEYGHALMKYRGTG